MLKIIAPAKINLALDVLYRRPDGYHQVDMVMQPLTLADEILLEPAPSLEIICHQPQVPLDEENLAWQAAQLLRDHYGIAAGVKITIHKNIPVAAGLAGGSTDAAAVLIGLNQLWNLHLTTAQLMELGVKLGADVPFCILQHPARAAGIGEQLTRVDSRLACQVLLITPKLAVSTPFVYNQLQVDQIRFHPKVSQVVAALAAGDLDGLVSGWGNVLETIVSSLYPQVDQIKTVLKSYGASRCLMSGSGPSVFALDPPAESIDRICQALPPEWFKCVCKFAN